MAASAVKRLFGAGEGAADVVVPIAQQSIAGPAVECEAEAPYLAGTDGAAPPPIMIGGSTATVKSAVTAEELAGPEEAAAAPVAPITREELPLPNAREREREGFAFVLHDVFTAAECAAMIAASEARGYDQALVNAGYAQVLDTSYRNSMRNIWDTREAAAEIYTRIAPFLPSEREPHQFGYTAERTLLKCEGLNERLRFLRYDAGDFFAAHKDGCYMRPDCSAQSYLTLMLYLNSGDGVEFTGGETSFVSESGGQRDVALGPRAGDVLIFTHPVLHQGNEVTSGRKYAVRTDVMYSSGEPENDTEDDELC